MCLVFASYNKYGNFTTKLISNLYIFHSLAYWAMAMKSKISELRPTNYVETIENSLKEKSGEDC